MQVHTTCTVPQSQKDWRLVQQLLSRLQMQNVSHSVERMISTSNCLLINPYDAEIYLYKPQQDIFKITCHINY